MSLLLILAWRILGTDSQLSCCVWFANECFFFFFIGNYRLNARKILFGYEKSLSERGR